MPQPADRTQSALRSAIEEGRAQLGADLLAGVTATEACSRFAEVCDQLVRSLLPNEDDLSGVALVATGGWGRREMCPRSDLDLLLLTEKPAAVAELADTILYPLWDSGLKVGHAVRTPSEVEELARRDVKTATALLDARLLAGDLALFDALSAARRRAISPGGDAGRFVGQLVDEREQRHRRFGDSIYLLEPNIKHGIGGMRDLATAFWVTQARFGLVRTADLIRAGHLTKRQGAVLEGSRNFFLKIRSLVQAHTNRASDQLTFEVQEAIGPILYPDAEPLAHKPAVAPAVEALMRDYYLHASGVTQVMTQLFEAAQSSRRRRRPSVARIDGSFLLFSGKLSVASADSFDRKPAEMLRTFRLARQLDVPIHWHTGELIAERALTPGERLDLTGDRAACDHFVAALTDLGDTRSPTLLEELHRVGLIAPLIPEWAACRGRVQHDLYHVYTVDQHQLEAVNMLKRIGRGEVADLARATAVYSELDDVRVLFLATLLHDVGKPLGKGHSESGAHIARDAAIRFGLGGAAADRAALLVRQHLTMSHISQRRDLSDPAVIQRFADRVVDLTTLRELFLLTICDTAMTAPSNLTPWKLQLLFELYARTRAFFVGDGDDVAGGLEKMAERTREKAAALLADAGFRDSAELAGSVDQHLASALSPRQLFRVLSLAEKLKGGWAFATSLRSFPLKGHSEVALVLADGRGVLARVTGAFALSGISVEGAVIGSIERDRKLPLATDLFFVRGTDGAAVVASDRRWKVFQEKLAALLEGGDDDAARAVGIERERDGLPPRVTPEVLTEVAFADDASDRYSVLEVFTQDRVGLLSEVATTLAKAGVDIHIAKISTEGERATDVFYVIDAESGGPLSDEQRQRILSSIRELLS